MDFTFIVMSLFYWLFLSGLVFICGAFFCRLFITGPSGADVCVSSEQGRCLGDSAARVIFSVFSIVFVINAIHFVLHCAVMTETPLGEVYSILPTYITKTKYGRLNILRALFLFAIGVAAFLDMKKNARWAKTAGILCSFSLLVVIAMSGHQGSEGYLNLPFYVDIIHIVSVSLWIGGLFFVRFCCSYFFSSPDVSMRKIFLSLMNRFSGLATYCVMSAGLTGVLLSLFNLKSASLILGTQYGIVLLGKAFLVGGILVFGGLNKFFVMPAMNRVAATDQDTGMKPVRQLYKTMSLEVLLGFIVLLLTSLLTHLSPEG